MDTIYLDRFLAMERENPQIIDNFIDAQGNNMWGFMRILFNSSLSLSLSQSQSLQFAESLPFFKQKKLELPHYFIKSLSKLQKGGCIIVSGMHLHTEKLKEKLFDPYLDPVALEVKRIGLLPIKVVFDFGNAHQDLEFIVPPLPLISVCSEVMGGSESSPIKSYAAYQKVCKKLDLPMLTQTNIFRYRQRIEATAGLWKQILFILKPRMVVLECYYDERNLGISMACRSLGIPSIEYQHGLQGWPHIPYNFPYIPSYGYEIMPEWFFHWGEYSAERMSRYFQEQNFHKSLVAGKPAYIAWSYGVGRDIERESRLDTIINGRIPICVALPVGGPEQNALLEAVINQSPSNWIWLLRGHPIDKSPLASGRDWEARFPDKTERYLSSIISLHSLLQRCHHLITGYSTTAIEATALHNMSTTCIHQDSKYFLNDNIQRGEVRFVNTVDELYKSIDRGIHEYPISLGNKSEISKNKLQMISAFKHLIAYETAVKNHVNK